MPTCTNCSTEFTTQEYNKHSKMCLKNIETFTYNAQKITVYKNAKGKFNCYCSDSGCVAGQKDYKTLEILKKHLKSAKSHWIGKVISIHVY
jgi:hypothetical protein